MEVIVEDGQLSLAIGKKGQNVRLAAKLTGWKIDIKSEEEKRKEVEAQLGELEAAPGDEAAAATASAEAARLPRAARQPSAAGSAEATKLAASGEDGGERMPLPATAKTRRGHGWRRRRRDDGQTVENVIRRHQKLNGNCSDL